MAAVLTEQVQNAFRGDLAAFYFFADPRGRAAGDLRLVCRRGNFPLPETLAGEGELAAFMRDCRETLVFTGSGAAGAAGGPGAFLRQALLHPAMRSGVVLYIGGFKGDIGLVFANAARPRRCGGETLRFFDAYARLAGRMMERTGRLARSGGPPMPPPLG